MGNGIKWVKVYTNNVIQIYMMRLKNTSEKFILQYVPKRFTVFSQFEKKDLNVYICTYFGSINAILYKMLISRPWFPLVLM